MHSNYFMGMYTVNGHATPIATLPSGSNADLKPTFASVSNQHSASTANSLAIRNNAASQNGLHSNLNSQPPVANTSQSQHQQQQPQQQQQQPENTSNTGYTSQVASSHMCVICGHTFHKSSGLKRHMKVHLNDPNPTAKPDIQSNAVDNSPYKCNACKVDYLNAPAFEHHIKTEHGQPQALKCVDCGCFRPVILSSSVPFRCEGCAQRNCEQYDGNGILKYRITTNVDVNPTATQQIHVNPTKNVKMDMATLIQSMRAGETNGRRPRKLHQCPDCDKSYKHQSTLAMHKKIHTGEYKYKCEYCDKEFYLTEYYNRHMRVHTKEKPYQCDVCDRAFSQSNTLIQHKRIHTGEKPYECTICGKNFTVKDYLMKHIRVHTGEKPFECQCGKKYTQRSGLKSHQKSHFPEQSIANGSQERAHHLDISQQLHGQSVRLM